MADAPTNPIPVPRQYPWQASVIEQFQAAWQAQRFPHALLLQGAPGLGKRHLAAWLSAAVLCENSNPNLRVCGTCASCLLINAHSHPDLLWVSPEEQKQQISVDQIRAATSRLTHTSYRQGYKVAVVEPAHQMTVNAANSLLKTLEEPTPKSLLILITSQASSLLPTVRSRCQKVVVQAPGTAEALAWVETETGISTSADLLEFAGRAPLRAAELAQGWFEQLDGEMQRSLDQLASGGTDVTQVATEWSKEGLIDRLTWLDLWLSSTARGLIGGTADLFTFPARSAHLPSLPATLNISALYTLVDQIRALKAQLARTALQRELAVESVLISLLQTLAPASAGR
ncbi:MAG: DNA polymerase III subunit delta' [Povalibacter sp.]